MTSAGEKQHYVLCLLDKLFQHIPLLMQLGVLYDIACQLHRSCEKFKFLPHVFDCIVFGISVGHQWPCQITYHPCKCPGFRLSDDESAERFWSSTGYYNQIYTLDTQVKHLDYKSLLKLGNWLHQKWLTTAERKKDAIVILESLYAENIFSDFLRA